MAVQGRQIAASKGALRILIGLKILSFWMRTKGEHARDIEIRGNVAIIQELRSAVLRDRLTTPAGFGISTHPNHVAI